VGEDDLIQTIFAPLAAGYAGALGLADDAAVLSPAPGEDLVLTTDAVAEGVHFFTDDSPADIAWKALAVNVSDLTAKGARPVAYLMSLSFPDLPERAWLDSLALGLAEAQQAFSIALAGGDTDRRPGPVTVTVTAVGAVPAGRLVRRGSARAGDVLFLSGTIGDSALGLALRSGTLSPEEAGLDATAAAFLVGRYLRPAPPLPLAPLLVSFASAAMDVSDGLIKDCGRLARASGLGAEIDGARLPFSAAATAAIRACPRLFAAAVTGGDDYQVLGTVAPDRAGPLEAAAAAAGVRLAIIGRMVEGRGVVVTGPDGRPIPFATPGWDHFPGPAGS
jgi:thiamine-monophosphate kinase